MSAKRSDAPSRTEKLVSLTYALMTRRRGYTRGELRDRVADYQGLDDGAFERKFERDKNDLRALGVPLRTISEDTLYENNNQETRYLIRPEEYRLPPVAFDPDEAAALGLAAKVWKDPTIESAAARAINRMAVDELIGAEAAFETFEPRLHAGDAAFGDVLRAVWERGAIRFGYRAVDGTESTRTVDPWGVGNRFGHWYLVGRDHARDGQRTFRLSRITSNVARVGGAAFERPEGFRVADAIDALDPAAATARGVLALRPGRGLGLRARSAGVAEADPPSTSVADPSPAAVPPGYEAVPIAFHDAEATAEEIAELGDAAVVLAPPALREAVSRRLDGALAAQRQPRPDYALRSTASSGKTPATEMVARALDIIAYVVREGAPTLEETAARFGLTQRRLIENLTTIRLCGVPNGYPDELIDVDYDEGIIRIANAEGLAMPIRLNLLEAFSLIVGLRTILDLPGVEPAAAGVARSALDKLRASAGEFGDLGELVSTRLASTEEGGLTGRLAAAIEAHRVVEIEYHNASRDEVSRRAVEPVRLLEDAGRTYLQAWCRSASGARNFRLDRILSAAETGEVFAEDRVRHALVAERLFTPGADDAVVVLRFSARLRPLAAEFAPVRSAVVGDSLAAEVRIATPEQLPALVARHGGELTVLEPEAAADRTVAWLEAAVAPYRKEIL